MNDTIDRTTSAHEASVHGGAPQTVEASAVEMTRETGALPVATSRAIVASMTVNHGKTAVFSVTVVSDATVSHDAEADNGSSATMTVISNAAASTAQTVTATVMARGAA